MQPLLLDASVWLAAVDRGDTHHVIVRRLIEAAVDGTMTLAALDLTLYEVTNVAVARWRSPSAAEDLVDLVERTCQGTLARIDGLLLRDAATIASQHRISVYDAAYLGASRRHQWTLVSADVNDLVTPGLAVLPSRIGVDG